MGPSEIASLTSPTVPGLRDNARAGVRRGRLCVTGPEVKKIFEPVVQEVIALISGQIKATKTTIKAVLLVGGFGQSAYLRDCIRQALGSTVEVMQSPNGYVRKHIILLYAEDL